MGIKEELTELRPTDSITDLTNRYIAWGALLSLHYIFDTNTKMNEDTA